MDNSSGTSLPSGINTTRYFLSVMFNSSERELILASGSCRRRKLLDKLNISYSSYIPNVDESINLDETAGQYVSRIACLKAHTVNESLNSKKIILAADTIISLKEEVIGKPKNKQHAKKILQNLSAKEHEVITGVCLLISDQEYQAIVITKVKFRRLSNREINAYTEMEEPYDKAGAYAIQGEAAGFVEYIAGSYTNVVGLPLLEVYGLLKQVNL